MSRHEGVSCDSCLKGNFRGRRYKCLVCYDYDLCGACYDAGSTTTRHTTEHPMQCILTRNDLELYYEGEGLEQQQAFTCPFCGKMGYTESALHEHVTADHTVSTFEVVCPICAAQPGGDPNLITDDFASHLSLEHRSGPRDLISFLDEPSGSRHSVRRIPHPTRGVGSSRNRNRTNMHFSSSSGGNATSSLSTRDAVDPIAELLSQLSGVRRSAGSSSSTSQLAHIQMQLQLERQQVRAARQQLERLPRRQNQAASSGATHGHASAGAHGHASAGGPCENPAGGGAGPGKQHEFLLSKSLNEALSEEDRAREDQTKLDRLLYVQSVLLGSLKAGITMGPHPDLSPLLPQLDLLNLTRPPPSASQSDARGVANMAASQSDARGVSNMAASQSDARGVTNIAVGGAYTGSPFELKLDVLNKQASTPPPSTKPYSSAVEVPSTPTPLTRTIAIPPPAPEKTAPPDVTRSSPREFPPGKVTRFVPRELSKIGPSGSLNRSGSSEDSSNIGSSEFNKIGPSDSRNVGPSKVSNSGPSEVSKFGPSEVSKFGPSEVSKYGPSEVSNIGLSDVRTCDVNKGGPISNTTSDVGSESPSVNDDVTNSTSPSPSKAKLLLAKKLSNNTRPSDIGTIRKLVALRAKAARQCPESSESLPTPQAANH